MTDAADFKKLAEHCLAQANKATSAQERQSHVESAMVWSRLAEEEDELWRIDRPLAKALQPMDSLERDRLITR